MKRTPNRSRESERSEPSPKAGASKTPKSRTSKQPVMADEPEPGSSLGDSSLADLEALLERRVAHLTAEKQRLEAELVSLDAAIAAELATDALATEAAAPQLTSSATDPASPAVAAPGSDSTEAAPRKRGPGRPSKKSLAAAAQAAAPNVAAPIRETPTPAVAQSTPNPVMAAPAAVAPAAGSNSASTTAPQDPAARKPTLGSRILAVLTREHPNAMNAAQLVEKLRAPDLSAPTPIAVLQSLRALRVNGILWSGDGESFGLTPAGLKRARAS